MDENKVNARGNPDLLTQLKSLRPIDDMFFRLLSGRKEVCQEILETLLEEKDLTVTESFPQCELTGIKRSAILDVLCTLSPKRLVNIEVQKDHRNDDLRRTRFHASLITTHYTDKNAPFSEVPNVTVIYISEYDALKTNRPVSRITKGIVNDAGTIIKLNNGEEIVFATSAICDNSKKSRLLQRMVDCTPFWDVEFPKLSEAVNYYKSTKEGREKMCKLAEELKAEGKAEGRLEGKAEGRLEGKLEMIVRLIKDGILSLEDAIKKYGFNEQELRKYLQN